MEFKIGDRVRKKQRLSEADPGIVVALYHPEYFSANIAAETPDKFWDVKCPQWKQKPVAIVFYDEPQRSVSLLEWVQHEMNRHPSITRDIAINSYEETCPASQQVAYASDELEMTP